MCFHHMELWYQNTMYTVLSSFRVANDHTISLGVDSFDHNFLEFRLASRENTPHLFKTTIKTNRSTILSLLVQFRIAGFFPHESCQMKLNESNAWTTSNEWLYCGKKWYSVYQFISLYRWDKNPVTKPLIETHGHISVAGSPFRAAWRISKGLFVLRISNKEFIIWAMLVLTEREEHETYENHLTVRQKSCSHFWL